MQLTETAYRFNSTIAATETLGRVLIIETKARASFLKNRVPRFLK